MHPAISKSYIVPAIFLNPVLLLLSFNSILSYFLPSIVVDAAEQPPPHPTLGPSVQHPHINIHASEKLCWTYTLLIVCAQLAAFGSVSACREKSRVQAMRKGERALAKVGTRKQNGKAFYMNGNGHAYETGVHGLVTPEHEAQKYGYPGPGPQIWHL